MKSRYDDSLLENQRLQDRIDSMEFVRKNFNSTTRNLLNSSASGGANYLPPTSSNRSGRAPSVSRFTSVERETESSIPPPYRAREASTSRRNSRDYSADRWGARRDSSTTGSLSENDFKPSNRRRSDRWSTVTSPNMNSLPLPGSIYLHGYQYEFALFSVAQE